MHPNLTRCITVLSLVALGILNSRPSLAVDPAQLAGIVVDDHEAQLTGDWTSSTHVKPFVGDRYIHARGDNGQQAKFSFNIPAAGEYQVLISYTHNPNREARVPVVVHSVDGVQTVYVNQKNQPAGPYMFHPLGEFSFESGIASVVVSTNETKDVVIADAVQILTKEQLKMAQASAKTKPLLASNADEVKKNKATAPPIKQEFKKPMLASNLRTLTSSSLDELLSERIGNVAADDLTNDEAFLRRVTLDIIGRQPTVEELSSFHADQSPAKRSSVVAQLLQSEQYGKNWANYWSDVVSYRVPEPQLTFLNYDLFEEWIAEELNGGTSWDEIVFHLLTARGKVADNPAATFVGFHQAEKSRLASETARVFLGVNIQCAECHDHPFIDMPRTTFHQMAAFFVRTEAKLPWNDSNEIEVTSKAKGEHKMPGEKGEMRPIAFDSKPLELGASDEERRRELALWVVSPENPWFAKAFVNHVWARLMGRGFSQPVDDIGEGATLYLPEVHAAVAEHFIATGNDVRKLVELIVNTHAYQRELSAGPESDQPFVTAVAKRLRGDQIYDSLATAVRLPNVTPPPKEATDARRFPPPPKSTRDLVNDAFGFDPSLNPNLVVRTMKQTMFMMNNDQIQSQIDASPESETVLARLLQAETDDNLTVRQLYQIVFAREPKSNELDLALEHIAKSESRGAGFEDLLWSLLNSTEFTTRR